MDDQTEAAPDPDKPDSGSLRSEGIEPIGPSTAAPAAAQQLTKIEQEMSSFERSTLKWARTAVILSGIAALLVCLQWHEMRKGGEDTHDLAVASGKEADRMKDFADRMKDQADKTQTLADRMKDQAENTKALVNLTAKQVTSNQELLESQEASLAVSFGRVFNPIIFQAGAPSIVFSVILQNAGAIKATHVAIRFKPYYSLWGNKMFTEPLEKQRDFCAGPPPSQQVWGWQNGKRVNLKGLTDYTVTIDARATFERELNFGMSKPTDAEIIKWPPADAIQGNPTRPVTNRIYPVVVGCIDYQSGAMPEKHQTGFIFEVQEAYSDPAVPNAVPTFIHYGTDVPREKVLIMPFYFGQGKKY